MTGKLKKLLRDESGITALETAIILIAFVVVAAVFAFTILSAGSFSTEQSRDAIYSGLEQVQGSIELRGSVVAITSTTYASEIDKVIFSVGNVAGGDPVDLKVVDGPLVIEYRDATHRIANATYALGWAYRTDADDLLEERETAVITVTIPHDVVLGTNTTFVIELKPPSGSPLYVERTTPAVLDEINDLH